MEDLDQAYGYILYRTRIKGPVGGDLILDELHDYAHVYLDGKLVGILDRRLAQHQLTFEFNGSAAQLDILVENSGRVNFDKALLGERKGITRQVTLAGVPLLGWDIYPLPMLQTSDLHYSPASCQGPCFYRGTFTVPTAGDTFLDTSSFTKGMVWLNGHPLGRVWNIGPQKTLYVPGVWLRSSENTVVVFDLGGQSNRTLIGRQKPILGSTAQWLLSRLLLHRRVSALAAALLIMAIASLIALAIFGRKKQTLRQSA
jgi:beta-galactosidase